MLCVDLISRVLQSALSLAFLQHEALSKALNFAEAPPKEKHVRSELSLCR